jgi:hypothetical protein
MAEDSRKLDAIEDALVELQAADRARIFDRTPIDASVLLAVQPVAHADNAQIHLPRVLRWVSLAACVGFAAIAGMWMLNDRSVSPYISNTVVKTDTGIDEDDGCDGSILGCVSGPNEVLLASCLTHDYDADGDVDLADFSAYQVDCKRLEFTRQ